MHYISTALLLVAIGTFMLALSKDCPKKAGKFSAIGVGLLGFASLISL